jgi:phosphoglycerate dehydrogenase-like enzyme
LSKELVVYYPRDLGKETAAQLRRKLGPQVRLRLGTTLPSPADYEILISGRPQPEQLSASPRLRALLIPWAGVPDTTRELMAGQPHIAVHNLHYNARPVAEHAIALLLAAAKGLLPPDRALRHNDWRPRYEPADSVMLEGKSALVLGYGAVGRRVVELCLGLGMEVAAIRRRPAATGREASPVRVAAVAALHELLPDADVLIVCLPHTVETEGLIGAAELDLLPPGAIVINVGRGAVIDEGALYHALASGQLYSAGLDVWYHYPASEHERANTPPSAYPFHELDNVVMSPHRAAHVTEKEEIRVELLAEMLNTAAREGSLPNPVDLEAGY